MKGEVPHSVFLKSIMSTPIRTLPSSATVKQTIQLMRIHKIKHLPVTDITNKEQIIAKVTQEYLAEVIRIAVVEKTFRSYRKSNKRTLQTNFCKCSYYNAICWITNDYTCIIRDIFR